MMCSSHMGLPQYFNGLEVFALINQFTEKTKQNKNKDYFILQPHFCVSDHCSIAWLVFDQALAVGQIALYFPWEYSGMQRRSRWLSDYKVYEVFLLKRGFHQRRSRTLRLSNTTLISSVGHGYRTLAVCLDPVLWTSHMILFFWTKVSPKKSIHGVFLYFNGL